NKFKKLYLDVFSTALQQLAETDSVSGDEDAISERLILILRKVCFNIYRSGNREVRTPIWEVPIQPVTEDELKGGKSKKRPDFTCKCVNPWADSPEEQEMSFHVECKRLGSPTSPSWILNKNYVKNGIKRFDCKTHEYGKRAPSGMMIGYIISLTPKEIEAEVNGYQKKYVPGYADITFISDAIALFQAHQEIERKNLYPVQFELIHLWIDLRNNYQPGEDSLLL
ncbi:MAG: hypothetical protein GY950_04015, partial [bacterium]|nr:hypothetical protein [bacterium]